MANVLEVHRCEGGSHRRYQVGEHEYDVEVNAQAEAFEIRNPDASVEVVVAIYEHLQQNGYE